LNPVPTDQKAITLGGDKGFDAADYSRGSGRTIRERAVPPAAFSTKNVLAG
jgi:hypothetical protein